MPVRARGQASGGIEIRRERRSDIAFRERLLDAAFGAGRFGLTSAKEKGTANGRPQASQLRSMLRRQQAYLKQ
jgi:hypothetical protein